MNFTDPDILTGVIRTLKASGRAMQMIDYAAVRKDGEIDAGSIGANF